MSNIMKNKNGKTVRQFDLEENFLREFPSASEAAEFLGKNRSRSIDITSCCNGKQKSAFGHKWKYNEISKEKIRK